MYVSFYISVSDSASKFFIVSKRQMCYIVGIKGTTANKVVDLRLDRRTTLSLGQSFGVVFPCLKHQ
jgi:hypothetical protein